MSGISKSRIGSLDLVKAIAAFGIVGCHLNLYPITNAGSWLLRFTDMNVGVFGTISGFLLSLSFERNFEGSKTGGSTVCGFLFRKLRRFLPPYLFWSIGYLAFSLVFGLAVRGDVNDKFFKLDFWLNTAFNGGSACHLWYISALYYSTVVITLMRVAIRKRLLFVLALVFLSVASLCLAVCVRLNLCFYTVRLLAFVCAGAAIAECRGFLSRISPLFYFGLLLLGFGLSFMSMWPHHFVPDYILAILLVLLFVRIDIPTCPRTFCDSSFAVYLIHPMITAFCGVLIKRFVDSPYSGWIVSGDWVIAYSLSLLAANVLVRIGILRRVVK